MRSRSDRPGISVMVVCLRTREPGSSYMKLTMHGSGFTALHDAVEPDCLEPRGADRTGS